MPTSAEILEYRNAMHDLIGFTADYDRQIRIITMAAPKHIQEHVNSCIANAQKGFATKAA